MENVLSFNSLSCVLQPPGDCHKHCQNFCTDCWVAGTCKGCDVGIFMGSSVVRKIVVPGKIYCWLSSPQYFSAKFQTKTCYCWFWWSHSDSYWCWYVAAWIWVYGGPCGVTFEEKELVVSMVQGFYSLDVNISLSRVWAMAKSQGFPIHVWYEYKFVISRFGKVVDSGGSFEIFSWGIRIVGNIY